MPSFQTVVAQLLLDIRASRTMIQLGPRDGKWPIVAEAVTHGLSQIRNGVSPGDVHPAPTVQQLEREQKVVIQNDLEQAGPPVARALIDVHGARAQMLAPLVRDGRLAGIISVHQALGPRQWESRDVEALGRAQSAAVATLDQCNRQKLSVTPEHLQGAAVQAILDGLRRALGVQRCTLRQNVLAAYAFPVTHESREEGVRSLLGDFTIVQSGQPVIEKLLAERAQVVQNDCRSASDDPLFHTMLAHYGGMRAQIVTPLFRDDTLAAVVSIHYLKAPRTWTREEIEFGLAATGLIGRLFGATVT